MNATRFPSAETRGFPIHPLVSYTSFPAGYSSRILPPVERTIARFCPSGDQSAHSMSRRTSRGATAPVNGAFRVSMQVPTGGLPITGGSVTAESRTAGFAKTADSAGTNAGPGQLDLR